MNYLTAKTRITIGLTCLITTLLITVSWIGVGPDERQTVVEKRYALAESAAISCSIHLNKHQVKEIEFLLSGLAERNSEIQSAAIRRTSGRIDVSIGEHETKWNEDQQRLTETHVVMPLQAGTQKWGTVEILFNRIQAKGARGWLGNPWVKYYLVTGALAFFVVYFFLGYVLKQLDPSKAVPKRVRDALNTLAEGLILTDKRGRIMMANDVFSNWIGKHPDKLFGTEAAKCEWLLEPLPETIIVSETSTRTFFAAEDGEVEHQKLPWMEAIEFECPLAGRLLKLKKSDDETLILVANSSPIIGPDGKNRGVLTSFEDVTELEDHKVELSLAKIAADEANTAKSEFLARMSHEIRTPMNSILGYTEVLQFGMEDDPEKRQHHLSTIQSSGEHLLELINDILDLSKIESGKMELELKRISVHELIAQVVSVLGIKAKDKGIALEYLPGNEIPETVLTDGVRLKQTIINLVGNAIKFTNEGGVLLRPSLVESEGKTMLAIQVADTGIGMSPEAMAKIFDPFSQADTSITRRFGGTGLGLSISRELAEKLGGNVAVASEPGKGSIFTITIDPGDLTGVPLLAAEQLKPGQDQKSDEADELQLPPCNILIVDDSEPNRELVALFLKRAGVNFEMAVNGKIAVEMVAAGNFDAVLMDMHMPIMGGFEATGVLRSQGYTLPIIALTADAMAQDERKCREAGCSGFLPKPIKRERLYETLREAIELRCEKPEAMAAKKQAAPTIPSPAVQAPMISPTPIDSVETSIEKIAAEIKKLSVESVVDIATPFDAPLSDEEASPQAENQFIESNLPMDDEDFVMIANMFVSHLKIKIENMDAALQAQDLPELRELGHWLKGSGGSAGFDDFNIPGKQLEEFAKAKDLENACMQIEEIREMTSRIRVVAAPASSN